jgi:hypothetical protein
LNGTKVCNGCRQLVPDMEFCDQCGRSLRESVIHAVAPVLISPPVYACGKCGARLLSGNEVNFCIQCGTPFRVKRRRVMHRSQSRLRPAKVERFSIPQMQTSMHRESASTQMIMPPTSGFQPVGLLARFKAFLGKLRGHPRPRVRLPQPQAVRQPWPMVGFPRPTQVAVWPNPQVMPNMGAQQFGFGTPRQSIVYPKGFRPPNMIVHPRGQQMQRWPPGWPQRAPYG